MSPRPILKRSTSTPSAEKHVVHFPPSPALTRTFDAYSPAAYDRSPIVVAPNACALPERGGRTYVLDEPTSLSPSRRRSSSKSSRGLHPRAIGDSEPIPSLVPDLSSESDESDGFPSPYLENQEFYFGPSNHVLKSSSDEAVLSFLPHAPSIPYHPSSEDTAHAEKPRRRKERKNDASRDNNRIRNSPAELDEEVDITPRRKPAPSIPSSAHVASVFNPSFSLCDSFSSFALRDDGCLGGF
ncbi:hypothetical protein P691DRAFT_793449 [Macrolepiota fuliginosa MF-IS2]|uniref:Uncharacterized protein n=1 Tax=Macrolepiota fuliginosa MF-IS2 TaxID=1400762 RepID=A0A9P5X9R8_9AGAR|nr:hypothetical protein P691DRAFT_793449 [Macrolepiota fuliginosa MF-IS2]